MDDRFMDVFRAALQRYTTGVLKEAVARLGSQEEVARALGTRQQTVQHWINVAFPPKEIPRLAKLQGKRVGEVLGALGHVCDEIELRSTPPVPPTRRPAP